MPRKKEQPQPNRPRSRGQEPRHESPSSSGRYASNDEVRAEFSEAQQLAAGRDLLARRMREHTSESPKLSAGDVDAAWEKADVGEETVGGSNPTPDQDIVSEVGTAVGLPYADDEPLRIGDKEAARDEERWELDPASAEDYAERVKEEQSEDSRGPDSSKSKKRAS